MAVRVALWHQLPAPDKALCRHQEHCGLWPQRGCHTVPAASWSYTGPCLLAKVARHCICYPNNRTLFDTRRWWDARFSPLPLRSGSSTVVAGESPLGLSSGVSNLPVHWTVIRKGSFTNSTRTKMWWFHRELYSVRRDFCRAFVCSIFKKQPAPHFTMFLTFQKISIILLNTLLLICYNRSTCLLYQTISILLLGKKFKGLNEHPHFCHACLAACHLKYAPTQKFRIAGLKGWRQIKRNA